MNLVLFEPHELAHPLPLHDRRAKHVLEVLRRGVGDAFDAGVLNGPRGKATLTAIEKDAITLAFVETAPAAAVAPIALVVGLPRPQTARDILRDATSLGVAAMYFVRTQKAEPSYAQSALWSSGEWRRHAIAGAEQAFDTRVPEITFGQTLPDVLAGLEPRGSRLVLDNYESPLSLQDGRLTRDGLVTLAIGAERGWSENERRLFRETGFQCVHLGSRVLRTETAVVAALTLLRAKLGLF